ncbi:SHOCT domain-containing protein [Aurantimonas sp. Leaf443]|uniref:SHOCT domain-containing protein n=1 Tax=Aurantimonas sp. Leaf443 TaxID=1736378 RepID=UPI0006F47AB3|nr:SHOCT domain-containing protein [Aurantimonas sp. Leaf443]KQT83479.1 hypothetical protein ASG48_13070 [Aurantimonas sp. Leaf443]
MSGQDTDQTSQALARIAGETGFGVEAVTAMASAMQAGGGSMAQFNHPELGGFGQWSAGGMLMIGDMFNDRLKGRVSELAERLSHAMSRGQLVLPEQPGLGPRGAGSWWPANLGTPSSSGAQNGRRYAVFTQTSRLAVDENGTVSVYDTGDHRIGGVSQQQGSGSDLRFTSQSGVVDLASLRKIETAEPNGQGHGAASPPRAPAAPTEGRDPPSARHGEAQQAPSRDAAPGDPLDTIRRLAELHRAGHLSDEEFQAKKTDLLSRL